MGYKNSIITQDNFHCSHFVSYPTCSGCFDGFGTILCRIYHQTCEVLLTALHFFCTDNIILTIIYCYVFYEIWFFRWKVQRLLMYSLICIQMLWQDHHQKAMASRYVIYIFFLFCSVYIIKTNHWQYIYQSHWCLWLFNSIANSGVFGTKNLRASTTLHNHSLSLVKLVLCIIISLKKCHVCNYFLKSIDFSDFIHQIILRSSFVLNMVLPFWVL